MKLGKIVNRLIVWAVFRGQGGEEQNEFWLIKYGKGGKAETVRCPSCKNLPVILLYSGEGVIRKEFESSDERLERIRKNREFIYEEESGNDRVNMTFVRKEKVEEWIRYGEKKNIKPVEIRVMTATGENEVRDCADRFFRQKTTFFTLLRNDAIAEWVTRRLKMVVLPVLFIVLIVNNWVDGNLLRQEQKLRVQIMARQKTRQQETELSGQSRKLLTDFQQAGKYDYPRILDFIARKVPETVWLTHLEINPPEKKVEAGKEIQLKQGYVIMEGKTIVSQDISRFLSGLATGEMFREVRLLGLEEDKHNDALVFKVELHV